MSGVRMWLDGKDEALQEAGGILERTKNPRGLYEQIGASLVTSTQHRFEKGIGPDGSPWPPSLRVKVHGGKTLVLSSRLMRSITSNASDTGVEVGTNVIYAAIHQLSGVIVQAARKATLSFKRSKKTGQLLPGFRKAGKGTETREATIGARQIGMPARPYLGLDDDDTREIALIAEDWLRGETAAGATP